eukprot:TRINITY_DN17618_c0_g2_i1.p1 TRINITY_DN17618_c0_g2~~TRINITY_DN17618_c0_g2_i1.p1  ORF type:complete len:137 (-),score=20.72 TRINITY_DN17618_c0_g2_i1:35-385(-)
MTKARANHIKLSTELLSQLIHKGLQLTSEKVTSVISIYGERIRINVEKTNTVIEQIQSIASTAKAHSERIKEFNAQVENCIIPLFIAKRVISMEEPMYSALTVSYTHLTLPTICSV